MLTPSFCSGPVLLKVIRLGADVAREIGQGAMPGRAEDFGINAGIA